MRRFVVAQVGVGVTGLPPRLSEVSVEDMLAGVSQAQKDVEMAKYNRRVMAAAARAQGATWVQIGEALGISKQAVQKTYENDVRFLLPNALKARFTADHLVEQVEQGVFIRDHPLP